ncbi:MAG: hypothetical protein ACRC23_01860 [Aeromonas jandaei]
MKIDAARLKDAMVNNFELLVEVLKEYGFKLPRMITHDMIKCGYDETSTGNAIVITPSEHSILSYRRFSSGVSGDIFDLLSEKTGKNFGQLANELKPIFMDEYNSSGVRNILKGNSLDKTLTFNNESELIEYEVLDESLIRESEISLLFLEDNIYPTTQLKFKLWYDVWSNRICINWRDINGNFVGATGRYNSHNIPEFVSKYLPVTTDFKKRYHLYGLYENKKYIVQAKTAIVFEAEKSTLQLDSMNINYAVSLGSSSISLHQLRLLHSLGVEKIVFAFDEGLKDVEKVFKKIYDACIEHDMRFQLYAIYDKNNDILKKDSKMSPADLGLENFSKLYHEHKYKLEELFNV